MCIPVVHSGGGSRADCHSKSSPSNTAASEGSGSPMGGESSFMLIALMSIDNFSTGSSCFGADVDCVSSLVGGGEVLLALGGGFLSRTGPPGGFLPNSGTAPPFLESLTTLVFPLLPPIWIFSPSANFGM